MRKLMFGLLVAFALSKVGAAEAEWLTDLPKALAKAKTENKKVLLDFTGSDWCGWCIKFHKEALSKPEFIEYAAKNLVLVEVDFPHKQIPAKLKKANESLKSKYNVDGFPTFVVLNSEGKEVGRQVGYSEGGPKPFVAKVEGFK